MKDFFINNRKYFIYPIILVIVLLILSILNIHSSSVGMYNTRFFPNQVDNALIFGSPRAIRSDQYLVEVPVIVSQDINNEPIVNNDIGDGVNLGINSQPTRNIFSIFRPSVWIFFLSNQTEFSFSFYWWSKFVLLLIAVYLLLLEITKRNLLISISGSLLFIFTPFIQWWIPVEPITCISFGMFFFIRFIKEKYLIKNISYALGLTYWIIAFALILYPAFQVPMAWVAIFLAVGIILQRRKELLSDKKQLKKILIFIPFILGIVAITLFSFFKQFDYVIDTMTNTVYPGARFMSAGQGSIYHLLNGFYNLLMQRDINGAPFGNQSEASNFFMLYIPILVWVIYKNILNLRKKLSLDWIAITLSLALLFLSIWYLVPLPDFLSKYTAMSMVLPQRVFIGIGFANYILIFYLLSNNIYKYNKKNILDTILSILLLLFTAFLMYLTGKYLYNSNPNSFLWPEFLSPNFKILLVTIFVPFLLFLFFLGFKKLFISFLLGFAFISTVYINPIYKGLDILINTDLANYITQVSTKDDSKWIVYGDHYLAQYALANNANVLNGIHLYPQLNMWEVLDSEKKYIFVYNRYAHIMVSEYTQGEDLVELVEMDALVLNINPCDERLKELGVKYILSTDPQSDSCLTEIKTFEIPEVYIYQVN